MFVVVSYDISDNKRRRKIMKTMEGFGYRAQYSVFECRLTAQQLARLRERLEALIVEEQDDVRFYLLCKQCVPRIVLLGEAELVPESHYRIV